ncbi:CwfJ domain-containing protein [Cucurbitaria berberidis CBS 394.84]|uniref:CwfJ domain-containing protein n=1 Tax=Cucurbitaria berberidis CBS 394.84 TaxID=1168544 RepID=A0A9P4GNA6_9PLEO|nr:CwfJ domain-containing protein [Cucurbitaria berberidis CBS 394.84]KAF1848334.1 CwfJ domain-containing protein [Cucurbitaria berberidis CBS 394.84]
MASKILVIGNVNGQIQAVFSKLGALHAKNNFAFAIIVGNLFADSWESDGAGATIQSLVDSKIDVPLPTYFALGSRPLPPPVVEKLQSSSDELCHNLFFLGKRTTMKTSEGIRIVALGGQLDSNTIAGQSEEKYAPFYGETDAKILRGATTADILITSEWPEGIQKRSKVDFNPERQPLTRQCIADLDIVLKPRYHFSASGDTFYEREPFFHTPSEETDNLYPVTRFINLAPYGNPIKQKWIYAFSLEPSASHPVSPPTGSTACPLTLSEKKRAATEHREQALVYDDGSRGRKSHKRRKGEPRGPISASECFFCLANENIATHLVTSIGDNSYITTAKGPLPTSQTFPKLGFPCHMLIIPFIHQPTLGSMEEEERRATYAEMQRYRGAMDSMLKSVTGVEYGSVTWEVSKSSLPHTHWQYLPVTADLIQKGLVEAAFKALAENLHWPKFTKEDVGDGFDETSDFFRVLVWDPNDDAGEPTSYIMRFDEKIRFHNQFGREVLAKLLRLDRRIDWRDCGQTQVQEEQDVEKFKEAFRKFDFAA